MAFGQMVRWRRVLFHGACVLLVGIWAQFAWTKPVIDLFPAVPSRGTDRPFAAGTFTEQEARQLIAVDQARQNVLLAAMASRQATALNHQAGHVVYTETAVASMIRALLAQRVSQQTFPEILSAQAKSYQRMMDLVAELQASWAEWTPLLDDLVGSLRAGEFENVDVRLKSLMEGGLAARAATSSQRAQRNQLRVVVTELRAELAVVRFQRVQASQLYEDAADMLSDDTAIESAALLLKSAYMAHWSRNAPRALDLLGRVVEMADRSMGQKSPFAEWRLLRWVSEVLSATIRKMEGDPPEALRHFREALQIEGGLDAQLLRKSEHAALRWSVRNAAFEIYLSLGDTGAAKQVLPQMLEIARTMSSDLGDQPPALEALWASQLVGADMDRFEGQSARALLGYSQALDSARRLVALRKSSRGSLVALRQSFQVFSNLPEGVLSAEDALAYGKDWQRVASSVVALEPEHLESRRELWESHKHLVDMQVKMKNPGHALDDAASLLNIAQEMVRDAPESEQALQSLLVSHEEVAKLKWMTGSKVGAMDHYGFAIEAARNRVRLVPEDDVAKTDLWRVLADLGDAQQETVRHDEARANLQSALDLAMSAVEKSDADVKWLERAGYSWLKVATFQTASGESDEGLEAFARSVTFERRFLEMSPDSTGWSYNLWFALVHWGKALADVARYSEAMEHQIASLKAAESAWKTESIRAEAVSCIWFSLREMGETMIKMGEIPAGLEKHRAARDLVNQQLQLDPASDLWASYARASTEDVKRVERMLH